MNISNINIEELIDKHINKKESLTDIVRKWYNNDISKLRHGRRVLSKILNDNKVIIKNYQNEIVFNPYYFHNMNSEDQYYWLGFIYADGCITYNNKKELCVFEISLAEKDYEHLCKFAKAINFPINRIKYKQSTKSFKITFNSKILVNQLLKLGICNRKSYNDCYPNILEFPRKYISCFIRGIFDGDGSISICKNTPVNSIDYRISIMGNYEFFKIFENYKNYNLTYHKRVITANAVSISFKIKDKYDFLNYIYKNSNIHLERKYNKYNNYMFALHNRNIMSKQRTKTVKSEMIIPC